VEERRDMVEAGKAVLAMGPGAVLVTGGHLLGGVVADCLVTREGVRWLTGPRLDAVHTHGTGCVLSAAIAARLARGEPLEAAIAGARRFVRRAIRAGVPLGTGPGAVDPGWRRA
jgi:hydroxymethylpyrimidine/phosphomethylpyrimidine kinase